MEKIYDSIIIGAGPAGISTAIYNSRGGLQTALIERGLYGGTLNDTDSVENYISYENISGPDLAHNMETHVKSQDNIDHLYGDVVGIGSSDGNYQVKTKKEVITGKTIVIATGVKYKKMLIPGEKEYNGKGVSNCVTCDMPFFRNKEVIMIGGGDSAVEGALYASNIAKKVTLIHRRDSLRADRISQDRMFERDNIDVIWDADVTEFKGKDGLLEGVEYTDKNSGVKKFVNASGVFVNIGIVPAFEPFRELPIFSSDSSEGYILTREDMRTVSMAGIYAVGDIREDSIRQVVESVSDGAVASESIIKYLNRQ